MYIFETIFFLDPKIDHFVGTSKKKMDVTQKNAEKSGLTLFFEWEIASVPAFFDQCL